MNRTIDSFLTMLAITAALSAGCTGRTGEGPGRAASQTPSGGEAYHGLIQYRAKDGKQAIITPTLVAPEAVTLAAGTKVIGVFSGGEARAYPLFLLNNHQIVNDVVGGTPISASW